MITTLKIVVWKLCNHFNVSYFQFDYVQSNVLIYFKRLENKIKWFSLLFVGRNFQHYVIINRTNPFWNEIGEYSEFCFLNLNPNGTIFFWEFGNIEFFSLFKIQVPKNKLTWINKNGPWMFTKTINLVTFS